MSIMTEISTGVWYMNQLANYYKMILEVMILGEVTPKCCRR